MQKNAYRREIRFFYEYVLVGVATAIGEVGISGYLAYILKHQGDLQ
jgi:hypothetical protein